MTQTTVRFCPQEQFLSLKLGFPWRQCPHWLRHAGRCWRGAAGARSFSGWVSECASADVSRVASQSGFSKPNSQRNWVSRIPRLRAREVARGRGAVSAASRHCAAPKLHSPRPPCTVSPGRRLQFRVLRSGFVVSGSAAGAFPRLPTVRVQGGDRAGGGGLKRTQTSHLSRLGGPWPTG